MRHFGPANTPQPTYVVVEYDCRGKRATKTFASALAARHFYCLKHNTNKNPKLIFKKGQPHKEIK